MPVFPSSPVAGGGGGGGPATVADGADVAEGAVADVAVVADAAGTLSGKLRGLIKWAFERMPASLGSKTSANSLPVVIASDQAAVPVSGTVTASGPLTDTQLRASAVPVTAVLTAGAAVIGHVIVDTAPTTAVTQSGTWTVQPGNTANTTAWKVDGSAVVQPVSLTSTTITGNITVAQATGTNLHTVVDSGTLTAVTAITNALPAGSNVIGHVIADSGSTTVVTGNVTVVQGTGTNLHTVVDSGTVTANAGSNLNTSLLALDSTVAKDSSLTTIDTDIKAAQPRKIQDSAGTSITLGQKAMASSLPMTLASDQSALPLNKATRSDTYTGTANGTTVDASTNPLSRYAIQVKSSGGLASVWDIRLEGSLDNANFSQILQHTNSTGDGAVVWSGSLSTPSLYFRSRCASLTLGLATNVSTTILGVS